MVLTIAAAVFVFGLLVLVHELGHFATAKMTGMRVDEFAIGFGPKLVSFQRGETVYSIRAIPLGGFNDIAGMDPEQNDAGSRGYCEKPVSSRMIVILAGSIMNFILPLFLFFGIFFFAGVSTPSPSRSSARCSRASRRQRRASGTATACWPSTARRLRRGPTLWAASRTARVSPSI